MRRRSRDPFMGMCEAEEKDEFPLLLCLCYQKMACIIAPSGPSMARKRVSLVRLRPRARSRPGPGRPPVHSETWSKVSVVLFDRQIVHLDRLSTAIRGASGKTLNRAEIIRALIDGLL